MSVLLSAVDGYAQLITVLLIFVLVLTVTALTTKWMANYQKQQGSNANIHVIETTRIANNKFVQIIRVGEKYIAVAVCKDTVTMLGEIPSDQIKLPEDARSLTFKSIFEKAVGKGEAVSEDAKENQ